MGSLDIRTRRIGGALAQFWSGGSGPNRSRILSALSIAGYQGPDEGNKQELVLNSIVKAEDEETARAIIEELLGLLRESGYFDDGYDDTNVTKLRSVVTTAGYDLDNRGFVTWAPGSATAPRPAGASVPSTTTTRDLGRTRPIQLDADAIEYEVTEPNIALLISCLRRLGGGAARSVVNRRQQRAGIRIDDEYDVQDIVELLLKSLYNDVRREEPTPSSAGSSSRIDLHLRQGRIAVEVKVTRSGRGAKHIKTEIVNDIHDYQTHPSVDTMVAAIYDLAGTFDNPTGFEHDLSGRRDKLDVHVIVVPWIGPHAPGTTPDADHRKRTTFTS